jgi:hypothetical protein
MVEKASATVRRLRKIVEAYDKATTRRWSRQATMIIKRYADERAEAETTRSKYNILWSNVETLKPFLYSRTPKPVVERRHKDRDPIARLAAEVVERALAFTLQEAHFGSTLRNARDDYLLAGRGTAWVRYVPHYAPAQVADVTDNSAIADAADNGEEEEAKPDEVVTYEQVIADFVHYTDFGHTVAPTWEGVDCVWRWVRMSRAALIKRFGKEKGEKIALDCAADDQKRNGNREENADEDRALVCELWCKSEKKAYWFTKSYAEVCDERDDPLGLDEFFPCPRPIYATLTTDSLIPIPDFVQYQDQAGNLDRLTMRIDALTDAIKAAGVYDADFPALQQLLQDGHDNELIPVTSYAALSEKGGLAGAIQMLPLRDVANALIELHNARDKVKADLYEITGMSDIIRGNTAPDETATAQKIKSSFATKRLAERQESVARFAGNLVNIMGNVVARLFSPETLVIMTGIKLLTAEEKQAFTAFGQAQQQAQQAQQQQQQVAPVPGMPQQVPPAAAPPPQPPEPPRGMTKEEVQAAMLLPTWDDVFKLLRNDPERRYRIDIETDSIVSPDDQAEQQEAMQFVTAVGGFLKEAVAASQQQPELAPLLAKMLLFVIRRFRIARDLEADFEEAMDKLEQAAGQPKQPPPDPQMAKVQGELKLKGEQQQFEQQMARDDAQHRRDMEAQQAQQASAAADRSAQMDALREHVDAQGEQQTAAREAQTALLLEHIRNLGKIEVARITADATADADAEQHELQQGA